MRRVVVAMISFGLAVLMLVGLKSATVARTLGWTDESPFGPEGLPDDGDPASGPTLDPLGATPGATGSPGPDTTSGTRAGTPGPTGSSGTVPEPTRGPTPGAPPTTPPPPTVSGTFTGASIAVKTAQSPASKSSSCKDCADYGISVTITVNNGRITATSVAYSRSPGESQSYASSANNKLKSSILNAQTWRLGRVSGATYSGNAWELSVKDAMSKAGLPV